MQVWTTLYLVATALCVLGTQTPHSPRAKACVGLLALLELAACAKLLGEGLPAVVALYKVGAVCCRSSAYCVPFNACVRVQPLACRHGSGPCAVHQVHGFSALPDLEEGRESGGVLLVVAWTVLVLVGTLLGTAPKPKVTKSA